MRMLKKRTLFGLLLLAGLVSSGNAAADYCTVQTYHFTGGTAPAATVGAYNFGWILDGADFPTGGLPAGIDGRALRTNANGENPVLWIRKNNLDCSSIRVAVRYFQSNNTGTRIYYTTNNNTTIGSVNPGTTYSGSAEITTTGSWVTTSFEFDGALNASIPTNQSLYVEFNHGNNTNSLYYDWVQIEFDGASCPCDGATATPTPSPTNTPTATPTATPTDTATPTETPCQVSDGTAPGTALSFSGGVNLSLSSTTRGWSFTTNDAIEVTSLGVFDVGNNGLSTAKPVGLWTADGTLLASVTVPSGTGATLQDGFRYVELGTPVSLSAATTYVIGAYYGASSADNVQLLTSSITSPAQFTWTGNRSITSVSSLTFPASGGLGGNAYFGPNFLFNVAAFSTCTPTPAETDTPEPTDTPTPEPTDTPLPTATPTLVGDVCPGISTSLGTFLAPTIITGDTSTVVDHYQSNLFVFDQFAGAGSPEFVFELVVPVMHSQVNLTLCSSNTLYDTVLYLRTDCNDPNSQIAVSDDARRCEAFQSELQFKFLPAGTYYLFVDGYGPDWGEFEFRLWGTPVP